MQVNKSVTVQASPDAVWDLVGSASGLPAAAAAIRALWSP
jgi:hypothetical protein